MKFVLDGEEYSLDFAAVRSALRGGSPEPIREHWVEVDGRRWPPKQALALVTGLSREAFTSHIALRQFQRLGLPTSPWPGSAAMQSTGSATAKPFTDATEPKPEGRERAVGAFATLLDFLDEGLTERIRATEASLEGADREEAATAVGTSGMTPEVMSAVLLVRQLAGRLNDVVHASTIVQLLPQLLEPGERVRLRPSLAAGNDPGRPFDLETDRRIAEFKVAFWKGSDAMRMRGVFADLAHLAMDVSGRRAQLFVVGERPIRFLTGSSMTTSWALGRSSPNLRARFAERYGTADIEIRKFTAGPAGHVELIDLTRHLPVLVDTPDV